MKTRIFLILTLAAVPLSRVSAQIEDGRLDTILDGPGIAGDNARSRRRQSAHFLGRWEISAD